MRECLTAGCNIIHMRRGCACGKRSVLETQKKYETFYTWSFHSHAPFLAGYRSLISSLEVCHSTEVKYAEMSLMRTSLQTLMHFFNFDSSLLQNTPTDLPRGLSQEKEYIDEIIELTMHIATNCYRRSNFKECVLLLQYDTGISDQCGQLDQCIFNSVHLKVYTA